MTDACLLCHQRPRRRNALCLSCRDRVVAALVEAPALYVKATQATAGSSHGLTDKLSTPKPGSRSPLRDGMLDLGEALTRSLLAWEATTIAVAGLPPVSTLVRPGFAVQRAAGLLAANLSAALGPPYGIAHAGGLLTLSTTLHDRLGLAPLIHQLAAPCPNCDTRGLVRRDGDDRVSCRMCGQAWPERHYAMLTRLLVAESQEKTPPT